MENKIYAAALLIVTAGLMILWLPSLWLMYSTLGTEHVYQDYVKRNIQKQLHDKCSDGELTWVLHHLKTTDYKRNMNRSEMRTMIVDIQAQQLSQWEFATDDDRSINPTIKQICTQTYDMVIDELEANCTVQELHSICVHIDANKRETEQVSISKLDLAEDIVNVKRTQIDLNVTKLVDKFCIERRLEILSTQLMSSCSGGQIKKLFNKFIHKKSGYDVSCDQCVEKTEFIEVVIDMTRRHYHQVRIQAMVNEFCIEPELNALKQKLTTICTGVQVKEILNEVMIKSTCEHCVEKVDFIDEIINVKRRQFSDVNINSLILKYCYDTEKVSD